MRPSVSLLSSACRITLFTRPNCSLCDTAKTVLQKVQARRAFDLQQIDVLKAGQEKWHDLYAFDTPVIHVEAAGPSPDNVVSAAQKLMHRFSEQQVEELIDKTQTS